MPITFSKEKRIIFDFINEESMVASIREGFNAHFTAEKYDAYLQEINSKYPGAVAFRLAETPIFIDKSFTQKMLSTCESIIDVHSW